MQTPTWMQLTFSHRLIVSPITCKKCSVKSHWSFIPEIKRTSMIATRLKIWRNLSNICSSNCPMEQAHIAAWAQQRRHFVWWNHMEVAPYLARVCSRTHTQQQEFFFSRNCSPADLFLRFLIALALPSVMVRRLDLRTTLLTSNSRPTSSE